MRLLIIDNYDSFTYNLCDYFARLGVVAEVYRNDALSLEEVDDFDAIVLSPGPGLPADAGIMPAIIEKYLSRKPILGVCLGHQGVCEHLGGRLLNLKEVCHGQTTQTHIVKSDHLFDSLPSPFQCGHYHSWVVDRGQLGDGIELLAENEHGWVMAVKHNVFPFYGVQFHPESVMTPDGLKILENWLKVVKQSEPLYTVQ